MKGWGIQRNKVSYLTSGKLLPLAVSQISLLFFFFFKGKYYLFSLSSSGILLRWMHCILKTLSQLRKEPENIKSPHSTGTTSGHWLHWATQWEAPLHSNEYRYRWVQGSFQEHSSHLNHLFHCAWLKPNLTSEKKDSIMLSEHAWRPVTLFFLLAVGKGMLVLCLSKMLSPLFTECQLSQHRGAASVNSSR